MNLLVLFGAARAATLSVPGDYASISDAISAAADGDEIRISAGIYTEHLEIAKPLTLAGAGGEVVITHTDTVLVLGSEAITLRDLVVEPLGDRGISANASDLVLERVEVRGASGQRNGAGVYQFGGSLVVRDSTFTDNDAGGASGGHIAASSSQVTILDSVFTGGVAQKGGAIFLSNSTTEVGGCTFDGNRAVAFDQDARGGAIRDESGTLSVHDSVFTDNQAEAGFGGALSLNGSTWTLLLSEFSQNHAIDQFGGAIAAWNSEGEISNTTFTGNTTSDDANAGVADGGAVAALGDSSGSLVVRDSLFSTNDAANDGGGLYVALGELTVERCTFETNTGSSGAGAYISTPSAVTLRGSSFAGNLGGSGGALRWRPSGTSATLDVDYTSFEDNTSVGYGGALYAYGGSRARVYASRFLGNEGVVGGGLMAFGTSSVSIIGNVFCDNLAAGDPQSHGGGALVYQAGADLLELRNNVFAENNAEIYGGGLMLWQSSAATVENNDFLANGAGTAAPGAYFRTNDGSFVNNLVADQGPGDAIAASSSATVFLDYNDFFGNDSDLDGALTTAHGSNLLRVEPGFASDVSDCRAANWMLAPDSGLIDAGDPSITDTDGTRSDIGATGGPDGDAQQLTDADGDGFYTNGPGVLDCDDDDSSVFPGAAETPYDGVDQDCDGLDLRDVDGDGVEATQVGGGDCNDADDAIYPTATDTWYDGIDSDCDGADDFDQDLDGYAGGPDGDDCDDLDPEIHPGAPDLDGDGLDTDCDGGDGLGPGDTGDGGSGGDDKSCGCASAGPPAPLWALLGGLALLLRRRTP